MRMCDATIAISTNIVTETTGCQTGREPVLTEDEFRKICKKVITENGKPRENHLLHNLRSLQHRVNNLSIEKRKMSFV